MTSIFELYCKHIIASTKPDSSINYCQRCGHDGNKLASWKKYETEEKFHLIDKLLSAHGLASISSEQISTSNFQHLVSLFNDYMNTVNDSFDGFSTPKDICHKISEIKSFCEKIE